MKDLKMLNNCSCYSFIINQHFKQFQVIFTEKRLLIPINPLHLPDHAVRNFVGTLSLVCFIFNEGTKERHVGFKIVAII